MMSSSAPHVVHLVAEVGPVLSGRTAGAGLRDGIERLAEEHEQVVLDFEGVEVVTPGFADEIFGKLERSLLDSGRVAFVHLDDDLQVLHDLVVLQRR